MPALFPAGHEGKETSGIPVRARHPCHLVSTFLVVRVDAHRRVVGVVGAVGAPAVVATRAFVARSIGEEAPVSAGIGQSQVLLSESTSLSRVRRLSKKRTDPPTSSSKVSRAEIVLSHTNLCYPTLRVKGKSRGSKVGLFYSDDSCAV